MIKKILLLLLIAQSSLVAISQEKAYIYGAVVNEHKVALDGIVVLLTEDSTLGAITDSNGFFKLIVPANQ
jgi:hypothetical protein